MRRLLVLLLILSLTTVVSCKGRGPSDAEITDTIEEKLKSEPAVATADIDVRTDDGVVTLGGKVIGRAEADRAIQVARSVGGVKEVRSKLEIDHHITNKDVKDRVKKGEEVAEEQREEATDDD